MFNMFVTEAVVVTGCDELSELWGGGGGGCERAELAAGRHVTCSAPCIGCLAYASLEAPPALTFYSSKLLEKNITATRKSKWYKKPISLKKYLVTGMPASIATGAPPSSVTSKLRHEYLWRCIAPALRLVGREEWNKMTRLSLLELQFGFTLLWVWSPGLPLRSATVLVTLSVNHRRRKMNYCAPYDIVCKWRWRAAVVVVTSPALCALIKAGGIEKAMERIPP